MKYYIKIALQHLAFGLIIPISIIWKIQSGLSVSQAIIIESLGLLVTALADLPAGFTAGAIGNKRSLMVGAALHVLGMVLLFIGGSKGVFIIAAVVTGIAWAFVSGADEAYLHDDFIEDTQEYRKHYSTVTIVDELSTIFGMLGASLFLVIHGNLRYLFAASSLLLVVHLLYLLLFLPDSKTYKSNDRSNDTDVKIRLPVIFKNKEFFSIVPLMIGFAVIYEAGRALWQPHLQSLGISLSNFGLLFALFKIASIGGSLLSRKSDFKKTYLITAFITMVVSLILFGLSFKLLSIVALCVYLFAENYFRIYASTVLNKAITKNRAAVLSVGSVIRNATGALLVAGAGIVASRSVLIALTGLAIIKLPAIAYVLKESSDAFAVTKVNNNLNR